jgi:hypothetical protein
LGELNRQYTIHEKGFDMLDRSAVEYGKIKSGTRMLDDAVMNLGYIQSMTKNHISKGRIYQALADNDIAYLREISNYFYKANGIYQRLCNYVATMYRYDWYVAVEKYDNKNLKQDAVL